MNHRYPFPNMPGPGDPETWGPVTSPSDPRYIDPAETSEEAYDRAMEASDRMQVYEDAKEKLFKEKIEDVNGWFIESITEATDDWLKLLSTLCMEWAECPSDREKDLEVAIGEMFVRRVHDYCTPDHESIMEELEGDGGR